MKRKYTRTFRPRLEHLEDRCVPSAGFLDPTFNTTGVVTTGHLIASAVALYPPGTANAGKIVCSVTLRATSAWCATTRMGRWTRPSAIGGS